MIVSRRKRADRLSSVALLCLAAGLCGAAWLALRPPAPAEASRAPAASPPVRTAVPVPPPAPDDLAVLWPGASAASSRQSSPAAGFSASGGETPPFTILGLIASLSGSSAVVFVQSSSGVLIIHPGEVADGWKLIRAQGNTATFAGGGREITLSLAKPDYQAGGGATPGNVASGPLSPSSRFVPGKPVSLELPPPPVPQSPDSPSVAAASASVGPAAAGGSDKTVVVPQSLVDMIRTDPIAATHGLQIQMPNGQTQGVIIANVAAGAPAAPYFSSGDRILAVNGAPINSASDALNIYQQLAASGSFTSVTVTLERGGQRTNVIYNIK